MKKKVYEVKGLMEWRVDLPSGSAEGTFITVHFTGGHRAAYGMAPARYVTDDPVEQAIIEASPWFTSGRITCRKSR